MEIVKLLSISFLCILSVILAISISSDLASAQSTDSLDQATLVLHALSWMTFRENGAIMQEDALRAKWHTDLEKLLTGFYRRFVVTFQFGVLKQMTLNEGDACDPNYRHLYQYWYNDSTSEYLLRQFVMTAYNHLYYPESGTTYPSAYCDYRQGLVCSRITSKCECPPGATMSTVPNAPFPPKQRCLLKENEVCALIDAAANGGNNQEIKYRLPLMIFDPEKPLGCVDGTQCRFTASNLVTPLCYSTAGSPTWKDDPPAIPYGEECTLYLYYDHGMCANGYHPVNKCYNYGLSSTIKAGTAPNKTGICTLTFGPYGGTETPGAWTNYPSGSDIHTHGYSPQFVGELLTPRFIPLRGGSLYSYKNSSYYFARYYEKFYITYSKTDACSVDRTSRMAKVYKFYLSLLGTPPPGKQYVADEAELNAMLDEFKDIVKEGPNYHDWFGSSKSPLRICNLKGNGFECKPTGKGPDWNGNDGVCNISFTDGKSVADDQDYYNALFNSHGNLEDDTNRAYDSRYYWRHVLKYPYICIPGSGRCSQYFCSEDYHDFTLNGDPIYNDDCTTVPGYAPLVRCMDTSEEARWEFGACEQVILNGKVEKVLEDIFPGETYTKLERGAQCNYQVESLIKKARKDIWSINGYEFLKKVPSNAGDNGFCDAGKLLECKEDNTCGCLKGTDTRKTADGQYESDYCYLTQGSCSGDVSDLTVIFPSEQGDMWTHYGGPGQIGPTTTTTDPSATETTTDDEYYYLHDHHQGYVYVPPCANGNLCKFLNHKKEKECGPDNTGKTGLEPILPETTPEPTPDPMQTTSGTFGGTPGPGGNPGGNPLQPPHKYSQAGLHSLPSELSLTLAVLFAISNNMVYNMRLPVLPN